MKRLFDIVVSAAGIVALSPVLTACAIWIKTDSSGSALFRQTRVGKGGQSFIILKFRTMRTDSEAKGQLTVGADSRITRVGRFLRKSKLDELPQLFNVLKGDMSFVGPRPEVPKYVAYYTPEQRRVLNVRPGITDLASIHFIDENELLSGADDPDRVYIETILPRKLTLQAEYVSRASLSYDLQIILHTILNIVSPSRSTASTETP